MFDCLHPVGISTMYVGSCCSYYPLNPPSEEVNIDYDKYELYARLPVNPHVLLVPSDLRYFIKVNTLEHSVSSCCVLHPDCGVTMPLDLS